MLKKSKALSIALAFVFCMSFIAPALIAPSVAQAAAVDYSYSGPAEFRANPNITQNIGQIVVSVAEARMLPEYGASDVVYGAYLTISLPLGIEFSTTGDKIESNVASKIVKTATTDPTGVNGKRTATFEFFGKKGETGSTKILIPLDVKVASASGEVNVTIGGTGIFQGSASLAIGRIVSEGSTTTTINSVKTISDKGEIDNIIITENVRNTFENKDITLKLPNGFTWRDDSPSIEVTGEWGLTVTGTVKSGIDSRELVIGLTDLAGNRTNIGRIVISGADIEVADDSWTGNVSVNISGAGVSENDLVVAKYSANKNLQGIVALQNSQDNSGVKLTLYQGTSRIAQSTSCADGSFSFNNVMPGTYSIHAEKSNWLSTKIEGVEVNRGITTIVNPLFLSFGDLNNDGIVDLFDLVILSQNYGESAL
jgi:hypothetical protein